MPAIPSCWMRCSIGRGEHHGDPRNAVQFLLHPLDQLVLSSLVHFSAGVSTINTSPWSQPIGWVATGVAVPCPDAPEETSGATAVRSPAPCPTPSSSVMLASRCVAITIACSLSRGMSSVPKFRGHDAGRRQNGRRQEHHVETMRQHPSEHGPGRTPGTCAMTHGSRSSAPAGQEPGGQGRHHR